MIAKVILNPYARRWSARQRIPEVQSALEAAKIPYELVQTEAPDHAIQLAAQAVNDGFSPVIAAGGDGTISEVVNGLRKAVPSDGQHPLGPLGLLPLGSANDLMVNLGLPVELVSAAQVIAVGRTRLIDVGQIQFGEYSRLFDNNSAIGLEPYITLIQQRITRLRGTLRYLVAALRGILSGPRWDMQLEWDSGSYEGPVSLVTVGNGAVTGGLFYMAPHARVDDGLLTFVYGYVPHRLGMLRLLPSTMKPAAGSYVENPLIHEVHTTWLRVHSAQPTPLHADGEIQSQAVQDVVFRVLPGRLSVIVSHS